MSKVKREDWERRVAGWRYNPVTLAFLQELENDKQALIEALTEAEDTVSMVRCQGILRGHLGAIEAITRDSIEPMEGYEDE